MLTMEKANDNHCYQIEQIIEQARLHLKDQGIDQWQDGYPNLENIKSDISHQKGYIIIENNEILGYMYIDFDGELAYNDINGDWNSAEKYAVIHRLAISDEHRGKNLTSKIFDIATEYILSKNVTTIRIDTHLENKKMQHILNKNGFKMCGEIYIAGDMRLAFDKIL